MLCKIKSHEADQNDSVGSIVAGRLRFLTPIPAIAQNIFAVEGLLPSNDSINKRLMGIIAKNQIKIKCKTSHPAEG